MPIAPFAADCSLGDCGAAGSETDVSITRKIAMYSMEMNWSDIPEMSDFLRPRKSIKKKAQIKDEVSLTAPKTTVARSPVMDISVSADTKMVSPI